MKITLINPYITITERYGRDIGAAGGRQAPLGLCYLASYLLKRGIDVELIDAEAGKLGAKMVAAMLTASKPDAVGLTSTTTAFFRARELADEVKQALPGVPVIIGGPHVTAEPVKTMECGCFDYGVLREGEESLGCLLESLAGNHPVDAVQGIVFRREGRVMVNPPRPYIEDLDSLAFPARHLLPDIRKYVPPLGSYSATPVVSMITSRGCPYGCIFCDNNVFGRRIRYHSPGYVAAEIEEVTGRFGAREICFLDDTFVADPARVRAIIGLMRKKRLKVRWSCMTRVNNMTRELLREMKDAGCWQISVGAESGSQEILDFAGKGITLGQVRDTVTWAHEAGLHVKGFFMVGLPGETAVTVNMTARFARSLAFSDVVVTIATPIPGTEFHRIAADHGSLRGADWAEYSYWKPVFVPAGLSERELCFLQKDIYRKFYLRPLIVGRQLRKIRSLPQLAAYVAGLPRLLSFMKG